MNAQTAIIGAGAWGTAVAKVIAEKGKDVVIWAREESACAEINSTHQNSRYLPGVSLPHNLTATSDIIEAVSGREFLILAVPSLYLLNTVKQFLAVPSIQEGETTIGVITKGFLETSKGPRLILEALEDYLPGVYRQSLVYIAGPSHAEEVSLGKITGLIAASENAKNSIRFRDLVKNKNLFVFSSFDVRGVQAAAATKNVIAIAFGILSAFIAARERNAPYTANTPFGDGTESLLLAAGLNEIQTLGRVLGATHAETFTSISGIGDLDVTCRSIHGRNRRFGKEIVEKQLLSPFKSIDDLITRIDEIGYFPEGVAAAKYVKVLADKHKLKMPISLGVYHILNREVEPVNFFENYIDSLR